MQVYSDSHCQHAAKAIAHSVAAGLLDLHICCSQVDMFPLFQTISCSRQFTSVGGYAGHPIGELTLTVGLWAIFMQVLVMTGNTACCHLQKYSPCHRHKSEA